MMGWQLQAMLQRDGWTAKHFVGIYARDEKWDVPDHLPGCFVINSDFKGGRGEHWVAVYIDRDGLAEYFDSYGSGPLEPIYQRLLSLGHDVIRFNTHMLQGPGSRSCGLYCVYFLRLRSYGISMQVKPFQEYHSAYNETLIRDFAKALWWVVIYLYTILTWNIHLDCWSNIRANLWDSAELVMDTPHHSGSNPFARTWWCAQSVTDAETTGIHGTGRGRKWLPVVGGSLALLTILGLVIVNAASRGVPPIAWDQGGAVMWNVTAA